MKIFDTGQDNNWLGTGFVFENNIFKIKTNLNAGQHIWIDEGRYDIGIISKNITGNGIFRIIISDEDDGAVLDEKIKAAGGAWSSFNSSFTAKAGMHFINIYRNKVDFGTIELGKIFIKSIISSKKIKNKLANKEKINKNNLFIKNIIKIAVIVPYKIFGGAEIYLREYFKKFINIPNIKIIFLYMGNNKLSEYLNNDNIFHKNLLSKEHLKLNLESNNYDSIIFYNSLFVYNIIFDLKKEDCIKSSIIEIYHSDFEWQDSISSYKQRSFVDRVIRVSDLLYNDVNGMNSDDIVTIPMGIDLDRFKKRNKNIVRNKLGIPRDKVVFGMVSRLSKEKNIEYFLNLSRQNKEALFVVVGDGQDKDSLVDLSKHFGNNIKFIGYSEQPEYYYNCFDGFLLTSKMEGLPISIMEAMASEVPVFCSKVGAIEDLIEDGKTGFFLTGDLHFDSDLISKNLNIKHIVNNSKNIITSKYNLENNFNKFINSILFFGEYYVRNRNNLEVVLGEYV